MRTDSGPEKVKDGLGLEKGRSIKVMRKKRFG